MPVATTVVCPKCGLAREIGTRQLRRVERGEADGTCKPCVRGLSRELPDDADREWWLLRFSDEEIVELTEALCGSGSVEAVRAWRARLFRPRTRRAAVAALAPIRRGRSLSLRRSPPMGGSGLDARTSFGCQPAPVAVFECEHRRS